MILIRDHSAVPVLHDCNVRFKEQIGVCQVLLKTQKQSIHNDQTCHLSSSAGMIPPSAASEFSRLSWIKLSFSVPSGRMNQSSLLLSCPHTAEGESVCADQSTFTETNAGIVWKKEYSTTYYLPAAKKVLSQAYVTRTDWNPLHQTLGRKHTAFQLRSEGGYCQHWKT